MNITTTNRRAHRAAAMAIVLIAATAPARAAGMPEGNFGMSEQG